MKKIILLPLAWFIYQEVSTESLSVAKKQRPMANVVVAKAKIELIRDRGPVRPMSR
ncbi:hypothetical protein KT99_11969 [Shewanella benthica KT99]|uniref:Uncharacterized protein n=1 Tax=Shewanella benthica KT99 TaxID=314608 RepID=A9DI18_9GAMM|nr:hypothetical protein KT99_11969 [Shewanella benthica KT99]